MRKKILWIVGIVLPGLVLVAGALARPDLVQLTNDKILTQACFEQIPLCGKYILAFAIFAFASGLMALLSCNDSSMTLSCTRDAPP